MGLKKQKSLHANFLHQQYSTQLHSYDFSTMHLSSKHGAKFERARRAQSQQNMRARQQNRESRARGLALKQGLHITHMRSNFQSGRI